MTAYDVYNDVQECDYTGAAINGIGFLPFGSLGKVGSKAFPLLERALVWKLGNKAATIGGRLYSNHALDQMQNVGLVPSVIENTIKWGEKVKSSSEDTTRLYEAANNLTVVINKNGDVVTVFYGK